MREEPLPFFAWAGYAVVKAFTATIGRLKAVGLEHLPRSGRMIIAVNHVHWIDPLVAGVAISRFRFPRFVAKEELFRHPVANWVLTHGGAIPLDRSRADFSAVRSAVETLQNEGCMILFPEGTRSRNGVPGKPKSGVAFLAQQTGAPVFPARLWNTDKFPSLSPLRIRFGPPMRFEGDAGRESYRQFSEKVMTEIFQL